MLSHDVDSCELAVGRSFEHRRSRNEANASAAAARSPALARDDKQERRPRLLLDDANGSGS
jgi:hypothetical protein